MEVYLLRKGISLDNIKSMSEREVMEYIGILQIYDELEAEAMQGNR